MKDDKTATTPVPNKKEAQSAAATTTTTTSTSAANTKPQKKGTYNPKSAQKTPSDKKRQSISSSANALNSKDAAVSPAPAMDVHPYPRGSVIEVLYIPAIAVGKTTASIQAAKSSDNWYWSEDSSLCSTTSNSSEGEEEDDEKDSKDVAMKDAKEKKSPKKDENDSPGKDHHHHHHHHHHQNAASVRLCDIIDRVPVNASDTSTTGQQHQQKWRYYVHYKDFNRRMDEWIPVNRIVSPPSVGNAKARALKKEEDKQKRKQQRAEQQKKEQKLIGDLDVTGPRSSRRRNSVQAPVTPSAGAALSPAAGAGGNLPLGGDVVGPVGETEKGRRTRLRRRSTHLEDDATVVAGNQDEAVDEKAPAAVKEILTLDTGASSVMATTTAGEHVVATIAAQELDEHEGLDEASLREHEEITKIKNVSFIELGRHQMETWYFSPIPKELLSQRGYIEVLYICEFTFRLFARKCELQRFQQRSLRPQDRHPPGNEIYRKDNLSMFEVDGLTERIYCQNLSYIAKLFLDHKTLYFDVDPFLFYVLCEVDDRGYHPVGYYSKEKYSDVGYNLACILTFPAQQRKGYGRFLIAFSYELSKKQEKVGGPERPVSDLGQKAYKPFWAATVIDFLRTTGQEKDENGNITSASLSIMDISKRTSIMAEDIVFALNQLGILKIINGVYFIAAEESLLEQLAKKYPVKAPRVDPSKLHWTPFLTDVKRDKFSIHSKKANVDTINTAVQQTAPPAAQQQPG